MEQRKQSGLVLLKSAIESPKVQGRLEQCLKENKGAFASSMLDLYSGDKQLQTCAPNAIIAECLKAAALNLPINKALGFAYVVVYNNSVKSTDPKTGRDIWEKVPTPTFVLGYKGYIQLAMRTGQYRTINADVVYDGELKGIDKRSGTIDLSGEKKSDSIVGYFAFFEMLNGFQKTLYMSLDDMASYALRYSPSMPREMTKDKLKDLANKGVASKKVGWLGNFNDMAQKTCIRRLIGKYGYMSIDMQSAFENDMKGDEAMSTRQQAIESKTVTVDMNIEDATVVDTDTGEVIETPNSQSPNVVTAETETDEPGY